MKKKPQWEKPELIVLVRSKPEEAVLQACKTNDTASEAVADDSSCWWGTAGKGCESECSAVQLS